MLQEVERGESVGLNFGMLSFPRILRGLSAEEKRHKKKFTDIDKASRNP